MADTAKKLSKVPKGMKKLSPEQKTEKPNKLYTYDPRPDFGIKVEDLPQVETWDVGKEYMLVLKVKLEEYREGINHDTGKTEKRACLRIVAIGEEEKE